ncbi:MAG: hypothetical protein NVS2B7_35680 [Herpetosiphon sp.]
MTIQSYNTPGRNGTRRPQPIVSEAMLKLGMNGQVVNTMAEGNAINALDVALRETLRPAFPDLADAHLVDQNIRIVDGQSATSASTGVLLDAADHQTRWSTSGRSANIVEASWQALVDSFALPLLRSHPAATDAAHMVSAALL